MRIIFPLLFLGVLLNCMSFRKGDIPEMEGPLKSETEQKPSIGVFVDADWYVNDNKTGLLDRQLKVYRGKIIQHYRDSGLFSKVEEIRYVTDIASSNTDFIVRVTFSGKEDTIRMLAILTGLTLYILPSWSTIEYEMHTKVLEGKLHEVGVIEKKERLTFVQQLFFIFGMPFAFPGSVVDGIVRDLTYASLQQASVTNLFQ